MLLVVFAFSPGTASIFGLPSCMSSFTAPTPTAVRWHTAIRLREKEPSSSTLVTVLVSGHRLAEFALGCELVSQ